MDDSRPTSFSSDNNPISLDQLSIPHNTFHESAILHTRDDITTDSECSSTDGNDQAYDLQLVVKALKSTLKQRKEQQQQVHDMTEHTSDDTSSSSSSSSSLSTSHSIDEQQLQRLNIANPSVHSQPPTIVNEEQDDFIKQSNNNNTIIQKEILSNSTTACANWIQLPPIKPKALSPNLLTVADQEKQDETAALAMEYFFNNQFMKAKQLFEEHASNDPLHSLGLSSMVFLKAILTNEPELRKEGLKTLLHTYELATSQLEATTKQQGILGYPVFQYFHYCYNYIKCGNHHLASHPTPRRHRGTEINQLIPNGILRAHIIKAECCLQMALLHLLQGTYSGYIQCGLNIRRAYSSYYFVWQEHQRMGQFYADHIDQDTLSGLQFGIGAVHLILDALPLKIRKIVSSFGWKPEKQLGMALIHLSKENKRIRSPWASLLLLSYYSILTSSCPEILMIEYTQPAIKILLEAQQSYPNSVFFLHFAGRISRVGRNLTLSTQSFLYAIEISKSDWAELDIFHLCSYEIGMNAMMQMDWHEAMKIFDLLYEQGYWSRGVLRYLHGACFAMLKLETDAILHFAQVPDLITTKSTIYKDDYKTVHTTTRIVPTHMKDIERYVFQKVQFFESNGYQDCKLSLCALEFVCLTNGIRFLDTATLEHYLALIDDTLQQMMEIEQMEYTIRENEVDPDTPLPCYINQRAILLWMKACIFNTIGQHDDTVVHLNWIADHAKDIEIDQWVIPYTYWEAGITAWNLDDRTKGREFWEKAARYKNYIFENEMSTKIQIALNKADELGIPSSREISAQLGRSDFKPITLSLS